MKIKSVFAVLFVLFYSTHGLAALHHMPGNSYMCADDRAYGGCRRADNPVAASDLSGIFKHDFNAELTKKYGFKEDDSDHEIAWSHENKNKMRDPSWSMHADGRDGKGRWKKRWKWGRDSDSDHSDFGDDDDYGYGHEYDSDDHMDFDDDDDDHDYDHRYDDDDVPAVPLPPSLWLFMSGLFGLGLFRRQK